MLFRVERRITLFFLVCAQMNTRQLPIYLFVYLFIYLFSVDCFMKFAFAATLQQANFWRQSHYSYPVYYFVFLFTGHRFLERSQTSECGVDSSKVRTSLVSLVFQGWQIRTIYKLFKCRCYWHKVAIDDIAGFKYHTEDRTAIVRAMSVPKCSSVI